VFFRVHSTWRLRDYRLFGDRIAAKVYDKHVDYVTGLPYEQLKRRISTVVKTVLIDNLIKIGNLNMLDENETQMVKEKMDEQFKSNKEKASSKWEINADYNEQTETSSWDD